MKEYERIKEMVKERIKSLNEDSNIDETKKKQLERLTVIDRLLDDNYKNLFENVNMRVGMSILRDAGVEKEDLKDVYKKLIVENTKYGLIDPNNPRQSRDDGEER